MCTRALTRKPFFPICQFAVQKRVDFYVFADAPCVRVCAPGGQEERMKANHGKTW